MFTGNTMFNIMFNTQSVAILTQNIQQDRHTSTMSLLVLLSCGSLCSVYFKSTLSISVLAYWNSLFALLKTITAISQSQRTLSSYAFFIRPNLRFVNVTCKEKSKLSISEPKCFVQKQRTTSLKIAQKTATRNDESTLQLCISQILTQLTGCWP